MKDLDHYDRAIIHFLYQTGNANINLIAEKTKMSWSTVQIHLIKLQRLGYVLKDVYKDAILWRLNN